MTMSGKSSVAPTASVFHTHIFTNFDLFNAEGSGILTALSQSLANQSNGYMLPKRQHSLKTGIVYEKMPFAILRNEKIAPAARRLLDRGDCHFLGDTTYFHRFCFSA